ncbi:inner membrane protein YhjD [soil metagenome]
MMDRLRALGARWPWLGAALKVQERFGELNGNQVAAGITLAAFLSLFPLILVVVAAVGFFSSGSDDVAGDIISGLGLSGDGAQTLRESIGRAEETRRATSIVGLVGLLYSGLGLVAAVQHGINTAWQVEGRGLRDKLVGLGWLAGAGLIFLGSFAIGAALNFLPGFLAPVGIVVGLGVNFGLFLWTFWLLGNRSVGWRPLAPGAILAAVGFEILKIVGSVYVPRLVASTSALYGAIGIVFAVLAWLLFFGRLLVYASVLNVTRYEAHEGTVSLQIEAPKLPHQVPTETNRAGVVKERETA